MRKKDVIKVRSSIKASLMRSVIYRGSIIASLGIGSMVYAAVFLPPEVLKKVGLPIFLLGIGLIALGLIPYRRLAQLEKKHNEIIISNDETLLFASKGKSLFTIPLKSIESMEYHEKGFHYGIGISLKKPVTEKIIVHDTWFNVHRYQKYSRKLFGFDLFLPYFSERTFQQIKEL